MNLNQYTSKQFNSTISTNCSCKDVSFDQYDTMQSINYLIELISCYPQKKNQIQNSIFYSEKMPTISFKLYLNRILEKLDIEKSCYTLGFILFEKFIVKNSFNLKKLNFHKLFFTALMISIKFINENDIPMNVLKKVSGIPIKELISLEIEFLKLIKFKVYVSEEKFQRYQLQLNLIEQKLRKNELRTIFDVP